MAEEDRIMTIRKYGLAYSSDILTVKHGFSIKGATNSNDWGERKEFLNSVLASNRITYVSTSQVHSTKVFEYVGKELGAGDGIVYKKEEGTNQICLVVTTADCVPVLFTDSKKQIIAAAHSGWKGTAGNIVGEVVRKMIFKGAELINIQVAIGPGVSGCCYEISGDRLLQFFESYIEQRGEKKYLNLTKVIIDQLRKAGIKKNNIDYGIFCTQCETELFDSYRREGPNRIQMVNYISL